MAESSADTDVLNMYGSKATEFTTLLASVGSINSNI